MSRKRNLKNVKTESAETPEVTDQLAKEALDQVVGGAPPLPTASQDATKWYPGGRKVQDEAEIQSPDPLRLLHIDTNHNIE